MPAGARLADEKREIAKMTDDVFRLELFRMLFVLCVFVGLLIVGGVACALLADWLKWGAPRRMASDRNRTDCTYKTFRRHRRMLDAWKSGEYGSFRK